jgi:hypothetical protein
VVHQCMQRLLLFNSRFKSVEVVLMTARLTKGARPDSLLL